MKFKLEFDMDNAAFHDGDGNFEPDVEISRILYEVEEQCRFYHAQEGDIRDINGNKIGRWEIAA